MRRGQMLTVFCYDISKSRIRNRVAKLLEESATRVQYSVFETRLTKKKAESISNLIASLLQPGDSLRVYVIGANGEDRCHVYGSGPQLESKGNFWLV